MIETRKAGIAVILASCGLLGWACSPAAADVRIEGQAQRAVRRSQAPALRCGPRAQEILYNLLK